MCPGLTSSGGRLPAETLPAGVPVAVFAEGKQHALAVGILTLATDEIPKTPKGIAIETVHYLNDDLWQINGVQ